MITQERVINSIKEFKKPSKGEQTIPLAGHINEELVITKELDLVAVYEINGINFEDLEEEELSVFAESLENAIANVCSSNIAMYSHKIRRKIDASYEFEETNSFLSYFHQQYNHMMTREEVYKNTLYISFVFRVPNLAKNLNKGIFSFLSKNNEVVFTELMEEASSSFNKQLKSFEAIISDFTPYRLRSYENNGQHFSEIGEMYNLLLNFFYRPIPIVESCMDEFIFNSELLFQHEVGEVRNARESVYFATLGIKNYPERTSENAMKTLLNVPFQYNLTTSYKQIDDSTTISKLENRQKQMFNSGDKSIILQDELTRAINDVSSGLMSMGFSNTSFVIFDDTLKELEDSVGIADRRLSLMGINSVRESFGLIGMYLAQLPGNFKEELRNSLITSRNFKDFSSLYSHPKGKRRGNHWGEALMPIKTTAQTEYSMNIHNDDVGSTNIYGATGVGKSVIMATMLIQSQKWDATHIILDKDNSLQFTIEALGGMYKTLKNGLPTGWNPFSMEATSKNKSFLKELIILLVGRKTSVSEEKEIVEAINSTLSLLKDSLKNIDGFLTYLSNSSEDSIVVRLEKWGSKGEFSWVFANANDDLLFEKGKISGFDLTEVFDYPELLSPIQSYLIFRTNKLIDGSRVMLWIDEGWQFLKLKQTSEFMVDCLNTIRKKNGCLIFSTQSPDQIELDEKNRSFITQVATNIFLPDPKASEDQYKRLFKISDTSWDFLSRLTKKSRKFIIQTELNSVRATLDFSNYPDLLTILSPNTKNVEFVEKMRKNGLLPDDWIEELINYTKTNKKDILK